MSKFNPRKPNKLPYRKVRMYLIYKNKIIAQDANFLYH